MLLALRRPAALLAGILTLTGVILFGPATQLAHADWVSTGKVGYIDGYYVPSPDRDYGGKMKPSHVEGGNCSMVQRKSGGGVWTDNYVESGGMASLARTCNPDNYLFWQITNDAKVSDTIGIRMYVYAGPNTGSFIVLCASKADCLAMTTP